MTEFHYGFMARALEVLTTADPKKKVQLTLDYSNEKNTIAGNYQKKIKMPTKPARPAKPNLIAPKHMPKRSTGISRRAALVHSLVHIELNAIDLAWDMIGRFGAEQNSLEFLEDWLLVAQEEAAHFMMLSKLLETYGHSYGDFPAHNGLWEAAEETASDVLARLAVIPMLLEARGIDTSPFLMQKLKVAKELDFLRVLETIYTDEIKHLRIGVKWFERICNNQQLEPIGHWQKLLKCNTRAKPKPPFNTIARVEAGMSLNYVQKFDTN